MSETRDQRVEAVMELVVAAIDRTVEEVDAGGGPMAYTNARIAVDEMIARGWLVLPPEDQEPAR